MSDMLPPPPYGPIVGHAPFRTAGRLRRPRVTAATGFRTSARSRSALPTAAYAPYFLHPKLLSVEHPLTSLPVPRGGLRRHIRPWRVMPPASTVCNLLSPLRRPRRSRLRRP